MSTACRICRSPKLGVGMMCKVCQRSYDRIAFQDGSIAEAMIWAANRARRVMHKRKVKP